MITSGLTDVAVAVTVTVAVAVTVTVTTTVGVSASTGTGSGVGVQGCVCLCSGYQQQGLVQPLELCQLLVVLRDDCLHLLFSPALLCRQLRAARAHQLQDRRF